MTAELSVRVNGERDRRAVPDRLTLADYLREERRLTGTHLGCEQGACGACTVLVDGASVRSCLVLAAQVDGSSVLTVEGLAAAGAAGRELQAAFERCDALQCGFCTPGLLMAGVELLARDELDEGTVRSALSGNLCRCTGYEGIVEAVLDVHERLGGVGIPSEYWADRPRQDARALRSRAAPRHRRGEQLVRSLWFLGACGVALAGWRLLRRYRIERGHRARGAMSPSRSISHRK